LEVRAGELDQMLQVERQELERQQSIIAPEAFEERVRAFQQRQLNAQNEIEQTNGQQQRAAQQASIEIQRVLRPIIIEVMESKQATIVFDKNQAYHSIGGLDVTTTVIDKLNSALSNLPVTLPSSAQ
ncbi:MAG: OmpH family outer membrane protein, partial [Sphingomonadales bacterium]|nr:OmpH family outer membrane protein [Sphingomonadales bacterium]